MGSVKDFSTTKKERGGNKEEYPANLLRTEVGTICP